MRTPLSIIAITGALLAWASLALAAPQHVNFARFGVMEFPSPLRQRVVRKIVKAGHGTIVTLSDGVSRNPTGNDKVPPVLGKSLAQEHPESRVVLGDIQPRPEASDPPNLERRLIDNTKALPFASGSVDLLLMRRGICNCRPSRTCGGIAMDLPSMKRFLGEVARVMNRKNPEAVSYLAAPLFGGADALWMQAGRELAQVMPGLQVRLLKTSKYTGRLLNRLVPEAYPQAPDSSPNPYGLELRFGNP